MYEKTKNKNLFDVLVNKILYRLLLDETGLVQSFD